MFRPLEAIVRSRFGYPGGVGVKFKVLNGTGRGRWRAEISFFQMYYVGTLANVVGKVGCNLQFTNLGLCVQQGFLNQALPWRP